MKKYSWNVYMTAVVSWFWLNTLTFAATVRVPADQPTIQSAIDVAENGDTVLVADGTYIGEGNVNINFRGKQITVKSRNGAAVTIIDCEQTPDTQGFTFQNGETNASVLDGFTIRNGMKDVGGGIYCDTAAPTIKNCIITQNRATGTGRRIWSYQGGGGIYCKSSDALIENCKITQNQAASGAGSGVFFVERSPSETLSPTLIHCTISENIGSAVFCHDYPWPLIKDCTIFQNRGPGIVCNSSGIRITNCRIEQNSSGGISGYEYSFLKINDCIIKQNTAAEGGGVYCSPTSSVEISGCIIARNTATLEGGGIYAYSTSIPRKSLTVQLRRTQPISEEVVFIPSSQAVYLS